MKKTLLILLGIGIFISQSCNKDNFTFDTDKISTSFKQKSSWAFPLVSSSISLEELLPDEDETSRHLIIDDDGFITLAFDEHVQAISARDFFKDNISFIPDGVNVIPIRIIVPINHTVNRKNFHIGLDNLKSAQGFYCANPQITLSVKNYWPIPLRIQFQNANYYKKANSSPIPITGSAMDDWHNLEIPENGNEFAITNIELNKDNSNLPEVIASLPNHVSFGAHIQVQDGVSSLETFNIPINTIDSVDVKIRIPMEVKMQDVSVTDTIDFDIGSEIDESVQDMIKYIKLNMLFKNGFPVGLNLKLLLTDDYYNVIDELTEDELKLTAGNFSNNQTTEVDSREAIVVNSQKIQNLLKAKHLIAQLKLNTGDNVVKLYTSQTLGIKIGALVKLELEN